MQRTHYGCETGSLPETRGQAGLRAGLGAAAQDAGQATGTLRKGNVGGGRSASKSPRQGRGLAVQRARRAVV